MGWWGPRIIEIPFPVYCILALVCKNSKPGKSRIFHDLWAAELCIWSTENGDNEEQPQPCWGFLGGFP